MPFSVNSPSDAPNNRNPVVLVLFMLASYGGVRRVLESGLPRLSKSGLSVVYAELSKDHMDMDHMEASGVSVDREVGIVGSGIISNARGLRRQFELLLFVPRFIRIIGSIRLALKGSDVAYVHGYRELLMVFLASRFQFVRSKLPIVWHCHGIGDGKLKPGLRFLMRSCASIIAVSEDVRSRLIEIGAPANQLHTVYNAVDSERIISDSSLLGGDIPHRNPGDIITLIPSASLREGKGAHKAVEAMKYLPEAYCLWLSGNTEDPAASEHVDHLRSLINSLGLTSRVHFIGFRDDIWSVMARSDYILLPSLWTESFGLAVVEPMVLGKPIIVSNRGAYPEVVSYGKCGLIVDPEDAKNIADALALLTRDRSLRDSLVSAASESAFVKCGLESWSASVSQVLVGAIHQASYQSSI